MNDTDRQSDLPDKDTEACGDKAHPCPTCDDGIRNGREMGVDCGGDCPVCPACKSAFAAPEPLTGFGLAARLLGPSLSWDGRTLFFSQNIDEEEKIFVATRPDRGTEFSEATRVPNINTDYLDGSPFLSVDGLTLYFFSTRSSGMVRNLWSATRPNENDPFGEPSLLFWLNSDNDDLLPTLSQDETVFMFASDRPGGLGDLDIWSAVKSNMGDYFDLPMHVDELSTAHQDTAPSLSSDGLTIFFVSDRPGGFGETDIWTASRSELTAPFDPAEPVPQVNSASAEYDVALSPDEQELFFASDRNGETTLWRALRECP